jgi:uncharacterized damage-inducible protein DinB
VSVFTNPASRSQEQGRAYTEAILGLVADRDPLSVLRETPVLLSSAVAGLDESQLSAPEAAGKWSIRHVVRHLADSEFVWAWRMRLVLSQDRPTLTGYDQDLWAQRLHYERAPVAESLDEFAVTRRSNLRLLTAASEADLARVGVHAERGDESVAHMLRLYAGHDLLHLRQIARIRETVTTR